MKTRAGRISTAIIVAIALMFVGDVFDGLFFRPVVSSQAPTYAISAEQASSIAQDTAPRATIIEAAVITSYNGTSAYAVTLDTGEIYVDASTGRILLNTVSAAMSGGQDGQTD